MAINATSSGSSQKELIPAGNYIARCYQMIQIGTVDEIINNETKQMNKVRIGWELPTETRVFSVERGEQPFVISKEYTLSLSDKANLRKMLASWRGKDFTEEQAKCFDISVLIGIPCMLNVIHKLSKDGTKTYQEIGSVSPMPKGVVCPDQVNKNSLLEYDNFDYVLFDSLPDFIKDKIKSSKEFIAMQHPIESLGNVPPIAVDNGDDLPF